MTTKLLLASSSQSRRAQLEAAGVPFETVPCGLDEEPVKRVMRAQAASARAVAELLAEEKALAVSRHRPGCPQTTRFAFRDYGGGRVDLCPPARCTDPARPHQPGSCARSRISGPRRGDRLRRASRYRPCGCRFPAGCPGRAGPRRTCAARRRRGPRLNPAQTEPTAPSASRPSRRARWWPAARFRAETDAARSRCSRRRWQPARSARRAAVRARGGALPGSGTTDRERIGDRPRFLRYLLRERIGDRPRFLRYLLDQCNSG